MLGDKCRFPLAEGALRQPGSERRKAAHQRISRPRSTGRDSREDSEEDEGGMEYGLDSDEEEVKKDEETIELINKFAERDVEKLNKKEFTITDPRKIPFGRKE